MITVYCYYPDSKSDAVYSLNRPQKAQKLQLVSMSNEQWEYYDENYLKEKFNSPEEMAWYYEV